MRQDRSDRRLGHLSIRPLDPRADGNLAKLVVITKDDATITIDNAQLTLDESKFILRAQLPPQVIVAMASSPPKVVQWTVKGRAFKQKIPASGKIGYTQPFACLAGLVESR